MKEELQELGLSSNEIEVYLVCLKLGEATVNRIADVSKLPRSTTHDILISLKNKSLISSLIIKNKTNYLANDPKIIIFGLKEKIEIANKIMPNLLEIKNKIKEKPKAEVFQGKIAVVKLLDEIIELKKPILLIGNQGNALEKIEYHPEKFKIKRTENKIPIKQILEISEESKKIKEDKYTQIKYLDSLKGSKEAMFIVENSVYHIILQYEIIAIKITSEDHAELSRKMFEELWKIAKKTNTIKLTM